MLRHSVKYTFPIVIIESRQEVRDRYKSEIIAAGYNVDKHYRLLVGLNEAFGEIASGHRQILIIGCLGANIPPNKVTHLLGKMKRTNRLLVIAKLTDEESELLPPFDLVVKRCNVGIQRYLLRVMQSFLMGASPFTPICRTTPP